MKTAISDWDLLQSCSACKQLCTRVHHFKTKAWILKLERCHRYRKKEDTNLKTYLYDQERSSHSYSNVGRSSRLVTLMFQITLLKHFGHFYKPNFQTKKLRTYQNSWWWSRLSPEKTSQCLQIFTQQMSSRFGLEKRQKLHWFLFVTRRWAS